MPPDRGHQILSQQVSRTASIMHFKSVNILWIFLLDQMCAAQLDMALHKYVYEMSQHSV